jgi:SAM-dependent methyltransferase
VTELGRRLPASLRLPPAARSLPASVLPTCRTAAAPPSTPSLIRSASWPANGYEEVASMFIAGRGRDSSETGALDEADWAQTVPGGARVLDLGCGTGVPISQALIERGFNVYGVDASLTMVAAFRARFPIVPVECAAVQDWGFLVELLMVWLLGVFPFCFFMLDAERKCTGSFPAIRYSLRKFVDCAVAVITAIVRGTEKISLSVHSRPGDGATSVDMEPGELKEDNRSIIGTHRQFVHQAAIVPRRPKCRTAK